MVADLAFAALGAAFDHTDVLQRPRLRAGSPSWAGRLAELGRPAGPSRLARPSRVARMAAGVGVAAAAVVVQVLGLLRWPVVVPFLAGVVTDPAA